MTTHKHHIVPKHAGGTDDASNLVCLTIEEHAEEHRKLYEEHGRWQDFIAWKTLSGQMSRAEAIKEAQRHSDKSWMQTDWGRGLMSGALRKHYETHSAWNKNIAKTHPNHPARKIWSDTARDLQASGHLFNIGDWQRKAGPRNEEYRKHLSEALSRVPRKTCQHCFITVSPAMFKRWHGQNCKLASTRS